ncbi:sensor histidine kinase [Enterococcus sp. AZ072]|uniref:sensor histidine kinase n=1 Tax=unclassified Enterococcus TaxID=2608891 RepID=UPI003D2CB58A
MITTFIGCKLSPKIELNYLYTTLLAPFTSKKIVLIRPFVFSALLLLAILYKIIYLSNLTDSNMVSLFLFIVTLVTLLLFYTSYKAINAKREIENERLIRQTEINGLHQYTKELENTISTLREFRHDYINILTTLEYGIKNNDMQTIKTVFERTISPTKEILSKTNINLFKLDILEPELKSILASKFIQISSKNIPFDFYITDSLKETGIDYIDLVRILSILLDNAFEETITQENPQIQVGIIKVDSACEIIIQNTIDDAVSVDEIFQKNYSTKHAHYGIGLYSVADIISKYHHVTLETMSDEKLFTQKIVIMNGE